MTLAGVRLHCRPRFADTHRYFLTNPEPVGCADPELREPVSIPDRDWAGILSTNMPDCAHTEFSALVNYCSDALLPFDRILLHGVALRWQDRAYLIFGPSGVGKSTQAKKLQQLRPGEFGIISGDRPAAELRQDQILIRPSFWNGTENWHGAEAAPLAALIQLIRGPENRLEPLSEDAAALYFFPSCFTSGADEATLRRVAEFATRLLQAVPKWRLTTNQVPGSTELLLESVFPAPGKKEAT